MCGIRHTRGALCLQSLYFVFSQLKIRLHLCVFRCNECRHVWYKTHKTHKRCVVVDMCGIRHTTGAFSATVGARESIRANERESYYY